MAGSMIDLSAFAIIMPVKRQVRLNIVEETVIRYMREGLSQTHITQLLRFDITRVMEELKEKKILYGDGSFRFTNEQDYDMFFPKEYKQCYIFRDDHKKLYFDRLLFTHDVKLDNNSVLLVNLGNDFIKKEKIKNLYIFDAFPVRYNPMLKKANAPFRKITDFYEI